MIDGEFLQIGNFHADTATKNATISERDPVAFPGSSDQAVFGIWYYQNPDEESQTSGEWKRIPTRTLQRQIYNIGLESFIRHCLK